MILINGERKKEREKKNRKFGKGMYEARLKISLAEKFQMMMSYLLLMMFLPLGSKHCNTDKELCGLQGRLCYKVTFY